MTQFMSKWTIKYIQVLCVLLLSLLLVSANAFAEETNLKHQNLFYPDGMPMIAGVDGVNRPAEYEFYTEYQLPNSNLHAVLFAEIIYMGNKLEDIYINRDVYVAIVKDSNQVMSKVKASINEDTPDAYYEMGGILNHIEISHTIEAVHLYLWGVIAGSGGQEFGTDYFFKIDKTNNTLTPILVLYNSFQYGRAGVGAMFSQTNNSYIADIDNDGIMEILTRKNFINKNDDKNIDIDKWSETIDVYHYNETENKYVPAGQINELPENAVDVIRWSE